MLATWRRASPECAPVDENRLLSRKELAAALGVSTRTVDRWIRDGEGPPATLRRGRRRRGGGVLPLDWGRRRAAVAPATGWPAPLALGRRRGVAAATTRGRVA